MKIYRKSTAVFMAAALIFLSGCGDSDDPRVTPGPGTDPDDKEDTEYTISLNENSLEFEAYDTVGASIDVETDAPSWKYRCDDDWVKVVKSDGTVTILPEYYYEETQRTSTVYIVADGAKDVPISVLQKGRVYEIVPSAQELIFVNRDTNPKELVITSNVNDWEAALESEEYFSMKRDGSKLTITPASANMEEEPRVTAILITVGNTERLRVAVIQRGLVTYSTYLGSYSVTGTPGIWAPPAGLSEWECEIIAKVENESYTMTNFGGLGFDVEIFYESPDLSIEGLQILYTDDKYITAFRLYYFDPISDAPTTYYGTFNSSWDGLNKVITFENTYSGDLPIYMQVMGYDPTSGLALGTFTDGYSEIRLTRESQ